MRSNSILSDCTRIKTVLRKVPRARVKERQELVTWRVVKSRYLEAIRFPASSSTIILTAPGENESVAQEIVKCHPRASTYHLLIVLMVSVLLVLSCLYKFIMLRLYKYVQFRIIKYVIFLLMLIINFSRRCR